MIELADLCLAIVDCEHKTAPKSDEGYPLIRTTDIGRGRLDLSNVQKVDAAAYEEWTRRAVPQPGDLILAREAPVGNVALITPDLEPVLGQRTVLIRPDPDRVDPDYLTYRLLARDIQHWMNGVANGSTVPHLNVEDIRSLPVPTLHPLEEQRTIGRALAAIDDSIENNRRRIEIVEEMARLIYREWFVHFRFAGHGDVEFVGSDLGPIPSGWDARPIGQVIETVGGGTPSKANPEYWTQPSIAWYTPSDLTKQSAMFAFGSSDQINQVGLAKSSAKLFPARTVMMTSRATIGEIAIATTEASTNQGFISCVPNERLSEYHLYFWLHENVDLFHSLAGGATFKELRKSTFRDVPVVVPPVGVESDFKEIVGPMCNLIENLLHQSDVLRQARDLLLPRLISGDLDVSDLDLDLEPVA